MATLQTNCLDYTRRVQNSERTIESLMQNRFKSTELAIDNQQRIDWFKKQMGLQIIERDNFCTAYNDEKRLELEKVPEVIPEVIITPIVETNEFTTPDLIKTLSYFPTETQIVSTPVENKKSIVVPLLIISGAFLL